MGGLAHSEWSSLSKAQAWRKKGQKLSRVVKAKRGSRSSVFGLAIKRNSRREKYNSNICRPSRRISGGPEGIQLEGRRVDTDTRQVDRAEEFHASYDSYITLVSVRYAIVCDLQSYSSIERLRRIKGVGRSKPLSILCRSLQDIDTFTTGFPRGNAYGQTNIFRAVKHCLPGPYTFILPASKELPKQCIRSGPTAKYASRKQVGVRIPDNIICRDILNNLDAPLISTSVKCHAENQWMIDPAMIADIYGPEGLDFLVDFGIQVADPSTVVDMTRGIPTIIRHGKFILTPVTPLQPWSVSCSSRRRDSHPKR
ncbi:hypothetical protein KSP40_PGU001036 [Platanthera guangdongensis]|uniref:Threonylcarbamoyl-AMP synthase n=1 Tax=Platanthera guangdongensis TaxID=2320717 RepID=A0ABR2LWM4_9ASPA